MSKRILISLAIAAGLLAAIALWLGMRAGKGPPDWVEWQSRTLTAGDWTVTLDRGRVTVTAAGETWQPDPDTRVQDALTADMDRDGEAELLLLTWRQGRYGESRPFWVTEAEDGDRWTQHIDIYDLGETVRPRWMASDIGLEAEAWRFSETARLVITDRTGAETAWDWLSWGLERVELRPETVTVAVLGELLVHRQIYDYYLRTENGGFGGMFSELEPVLSAYDVTALHLETPLVDDPADYGTYPVFGTPAEAGEAILSAGFDVVSCASNHALDRGVAGIDRTAGLFREVVCAGIQPEADGAYRPYAMLERNGIRIAVLSYTETTNGHALPEDAPYVLHTLDDEARVRADLKAARAAADAVLVFVHWGDEYAETPNETQTAWAQIFAEGGADVVLGTHPHVRQPWEWVEGEKGHQTLVYYSLGNCLSAQTGEACRLGSLAAFTLTRTPEGVAVTPEPLRTVETRYDQGRYYAAVVLS